MSSLRSAGSTAFYIVLGVALAFGINQALAYGLQTDLPVVAVESNSMVPTFARGDILGCMGAPVADLQVGDIIVFSVPGQATPIVHRLVQVNPDGSVQTRGDANAAQLPFEKAIQPSQIHCRVVLIIPYLGWVKISLTDLVIPNALPIGILILAAYVAYSLIHGKPQTGRRRQARRKHGLL